MTHRGRLEWATDTIEVSVITMVFVVVYTAIGIGAIGVPILAGVRRLRRLRNSKP